MTASRDGAAPVFVLGVPRSGTTLLALMLDAHSRIAIPYESHFMVSYFESGELNNDLNEIAARRNLVCRILNEPYVRGWDYRVQFADIDLDQCGSLAGAIDQVFSAYARHHNKCRWGDKTPRYTRFPYVINRLFPRCKFVHIIRDGRDVALSLARQRWGANHWYRGLEFWQDTVTRTRDMLRMLPCERVHELRFEDLVENPDSSMHHVCEFLGIEYESGMIRDYQEHAAEKVGNRITAHHVHLQRPPSLSETGKWMSQLSRVDQAIAFEIAGKVLIQLGYPAGISQHPLRHIRKGTLKLNEIAGRIYRRLWPTRSPKATNVDSGVRNERDDPNSESKVIDDCRVETGF